jgi:hypothetical protein
MYFGQIDFRKADIEPPGRTLLNEVSDYSEPT